MDEQQIVHDIKDMPDMKHKKKFKYFYFVSYSYINNNRWGDGNIEMMRTVSMDRMIEVLSVQNYIRDESKFDSVIVHNFIRLKR